MFALDRLGLLKLFKRIILDGRILPFRINNGILELPATVSHIAAYVIKIGYLKSGYEVYMKSVTKTIIEGLIIDVGANIGFYTIMFAREIGKNCKVIAMEPNPYCFNVLLRNIYLNNLKNEVIPVNAAAWCNSNFELVLNATTLYGGDASAFKRGGTYSFKSRTITIDDFLIENKHLGCPRFLKIDTEGSEPEVIQGAINTIKRCRPYLLIETHPWREDETLKAIEHVKKIVPGYTSIKISRGGIRIGRVERTKRTYHVWLIPQKANYNSANDYRML